MRPSRIDNHILTLVHIYVYMFTFILLQQVLYEFAPSHSVIKTVTEDIMQVLLTFTNGRCGSNHRYLESTITCSPPTKKTNDLDI